MEQSELTREKIGYVQWLLGCCALSGRMQKGILERFPMPEELFETKKDIWEQMLPQKQARLFWEYLKETGSVDHMLESYRKLADQGVSFVALGQEEYPVKLRQIPDPPLGLYFKGRLPDKDGLAVAIIGSRDCSEYGRKVAESLGRYLGECGIPVISGMARGIDGISQNAALTAGGISFGVLGCGVDICYPKSNQPIYEKLMKQGGILSSYPPGTPPLSKNFPPRNRIVSGLATAVVVVEAAVRSGTSITVSMALEQGRDVHAVPGRVTDRLSEGCNRLIKQGAEVYLDPEAFVEELQEAYFMQCISPVKDKQDVKQRELPEELSILLKNLDVTPKSVEEIWKPFADKMTIQTCSLRLMELVLKGKARQISAGCFCRA